MVVVLRPGFFGWSVRARAGLAGNIGFGGERTDLEGFFLRGVDVFRQLLYRRAGEPRSLGRHPGDDFRTCDAVAREIRGGRKRRERSGREDYRDADANFRFAEALQAGENGAGGPAPYQLKIERA